MMKKSVITIHCKDETEKAEMKNFAEKRGFTAVSTYLKWLYKQDRNNHKFSEQ